MTSKPRRDGRTATNDVGPDDLTTFVRAAVDSAWPSDDYSALRWMSTDLQRYCYSNGVWTFVDVWYGGSTDAGVHVVLRSGLAIWSCLYRGGLIDRRDTDDTRIESNAVFSFLAEVLHQKCERDAVLPLRGPARTRRRELTYQFAGCGTLSSFTAVETIADRNGIRYERLFIGGLVGDRQTYGTPLGGLPPWRE